MRRSKIKSAGWIALWFVMTGVLIRGAAAAGPIRSAEIPELAAALEIPPGQNFCGEPVPMDNPDVRERFERELLLTLWNRPQVILWLKRAGRYLPHIENLLKQNGLPDDLKYVAVAESALRPHAGSSRGAIGFWQFVRGTGSRYGLTVNDRVDERRNVFASTEAAIRYFKDLHREMGSWTLAAAAYNMGEKGLMGEILAQGSMNYYDLYLPLETQHFLFRILAIKLIFKNPKRYGFDLSEKERYPLLSFDRVQIQCDRETPIRLVAKAAKTSFKVIKDLNPEIRGHYLAKGEHRLLIPEGSLKGFQQRLTALLKTYAKEHKGRVYVVRPGDNLSTIARRHSVPVNALLIWNRIDPRDPIHPGQKLIVHPGD